MKVKKKVAIGASSEAKRLTSSTSEKLKGGRDAQAHSEKRYQLADVNDQTERPFNARCGLMTPGADDSVNSGRMSLFPDFRLYRGLE